MISEMNVFLSALAVTGGIKIDLIETSVIALIVVFAAFLIVKSIESQKTRKSTGRESLIGKVGTVVNRLDPDGWISIEGIRWKAHSSRADIIEEGDKVIVISLDGLSILVEKVGK
jgi:membrane-bound serine protease (ClpP class)